MTTWTREELDKIDKAEELDLRSMREDRTLRDPVTMWVVRIGDDLYVRAFKGRSGPWFKGVLTRHEGRITSGGVEKDVTFVEEKDADILDKVSQTYLSKYHHYAAEIVDPMVTPQSLPATLKLVPR